MDAPAVLRDVAVDGMHCAGCAASVERLLTGVPGVAEARVSAATRRAVVRGAASFEDLGRALGRGGYALGTRLTRLEGLDAAARAALERVDGVRRMRAVDGGLEVEHVDADAVLEALRALVRPASGGRLATEEDPEGRRLAEEARAWRTRFLVALPAAVWTMVAHMHPVGGHSAAWGSPALLFAVSALSVGWAGAPLLRGAWAAARRGRGDMDLLVGLGVFTALLGSLPAALGREAAPLWVESATGIVALVALGRWLEARTRRATGAAVAHLARLAPQTAWLVDAGGEREVPADRLLAGDLLRVKPGASVPADGVVLEGRGEVDEALLTGESLPVPKEPGSAVTGGTLNLSGSFVMQARAVGRATALARIARWVREAQQSRAPSARLADRVAAVFVPGVLLAAALTLALHLLAGSSAAHGVECAVAVLVVACPCALGLAVPTAVVAATGRGAGRGILFKGGEVLERCAEVQRVAFDKTGTLTEGRPRVVRVLAGTTSERELLRLVAGVEQGSEHPLARGVLAHAESAGVQPPPVEQFESVAGEGAAGRVAGRRVAVGRASWLARHGADPAAASGWLAEADREGATALLVALDGVAAGALLVRDVERPSAAPAVAALRSMGLSVLLLSGDRRAVVEAAATRLGIRDWAAEVGPLEKGERLRAAAGAGASAMVGDGLNDAPALAAADVGVAVGGASAASAAAAGVALTGPDLARVPEALALARATRRVILGNLAWASVYNLAALPLAALGVLPPMAAAGAMAASSLSVMLSSLRLARWRWTPPGRA